MKTFILFFTLILMISCTKMTEYSDLGTSLNQNTGIWKWESTCGGFINSCGYSSDAHYAKIKFTKYNQLIETHNS